MKRPKDLGFYIFTFYIEFIMALKHAMVLSHGQQLEVFLLNMCSHHHTHMSMSHSSNSNTCKFIFILDI